MQDIDEAEFVNVKPALQIIQSGDVFVVVYDETKTAAEICAEATRIHAFRDVGGVRWYFVIWAMLAPIRLWEFDTERVEFFVTELQKERKKRVN